MAREARREITTGVTSSGKWRTDQSRRRGAATWPALPAGRLGKAWRVSGLGGIQRSALCRRRPLQCFTHNHQRTASADCLTTCKLRQYRSARPRGALARMQSPVGTQRAGNAEAEADAASGEAHCNPQPLTNPNREAAWASADLAFNAAHAQMKQHLLQYLCCHLYGSYLSGKNIAGPSRRPGPTSTSTSTGVRAGP